MFKIYKKLGKLSDLMKEHDTTHQEALFWNDQQAKLCTTEAISRLLTFKLKDQFNFRTQKALQALRLKEIIYG